MNEITDGGPAFPQTEHSAPVPEGMTLRDYFAAKALQGLASDNRNLIQHDGSPHTYESFAAVAFDLADAMLKARQS